MDAHGRNRRDVLGGCASAVVAALAGCAGDATPPSGTADGTAAAPTTRATATPAGDGSGGRTDDGTTPTPEGATGDGLVLPSLDVGGSPGGLVPVRPDGRVVILDFFATWCAPCIPEMDNLREVRRRYDESAVYVVSVTQETDEAAVEAFWEEHRGTWPVVLDPGSRALRRYDVTTIPTILALAPDGAVVERHTGLVGEEALVAAVEAARQQGESG